MISEDVTKNADATNMILMQNRLLNDYLLQSPSLLALMIYINRKFTSLAYSITFTIFAYCTIYKGTTDFQPIKSPKQSYDKKTVSFPLNAMEMHKKHQYYKSN